MKILNQSRRTLGFLALMLVAGTAHAAPEAANAMFSGIDNMWVLLFFLGLTLLGMLSIFLLLAYVTYSLIAPTMEERAEELEEATPFWAWFWQSFNAAVPKSKEQDILLDHNYDGIQELDNDLPPWWKYSFYLSIVFGVVYLYIYHGQTGADDISVREYYADLRQAEIDKAAYLARMDNLIDESNVAVLQGAGDIGEGKAIYMKHCWSCHGKEGEGGVGPNLTDPYWLHGGSIKDVFSTVKYGVPENGMRSWESQLTPKQMQQVSSFILTMQGTNPKGAKEPQGDLYEEATGDTAGL